MSERPPEQKALFDRVTKLLDASKAQTPATPEDVAQLSDVDAALSLVMVLCADIEHMTKRPLNFCGHCRIAGDVETGRFDTIEEIKVHLVRCPHSPLVRAVWAALNAQDALDAMALDSERPPEPSAAEREIETVAHATIDALRRMVGR